jgi:hypothetical protein
LQELEKADGLKGQVSEASPLCLSASAASLFAQLWRSEKAKRGRFACILQLLNSCDS